MAVNVSRGEELVACKQALYVKVACVTQDRHVLTPLTDETNAGVELVYVL